MLYSGADQSTWFSALIQNGPFLTLIVFVLLMIPLRFYGALAEDVKRAGEIVGQGARHCFGFLTKT
ncbi:hypothetical protein SAMN05660706_1065 [Desulfoscipio geothermicus DSM 3669]|uniref:Uncharacterized protein n=1 Tax=Desulfoscipio geothermicus DSM 3669 TaxID=1121426 RepID=A0A1I6D5U5_9FIRM|nr:hypothetical protein SAMN05660706_1065 [Desulfoscipio geothermicus DSM 3669]